MTEINVDDLRAVITITKDHPDGGQHSERDILSLPELRKLLNDMKHAKVQLIENLKKELEE